jgi:hypothetical protein
MDLSDSLAAAEIEDKFNLQVFSGSHNAGTEVSSSVEKLKKNTKSLIKYNPTLTMRPRLKPILEPEGTR